MRCFDLRIYIVIIWVPYGLLHTNCGHRMRTTPVVTSPLSAGVRELFDAVASGRFSVPQQGPTLTEAMHATHLGCGLLQTAAGPGNSVALVRHMLTTYGDELPLEHPVPLRSLSASELRGYTDVWRPLAGLHPLVVAAAYGNLEVLKTMLNEFFPGGASTVAISGLTPMLAAMRRKRYAVVEYLAPLVSVTAENPAVTLMPTTAPVAMVAWLCDAELVRAVGADAAAWNAYYRVDDRSLGHSAPPCATPLVIAILRAASSDGISDSQVAAAIVAMIRCGADPTKPGRYSRRLCNSHTLTPLQCAVDCSMPRCVEALLLAGVDPTATFGGLTTADSIPVVRAIKKNHLRIAQMLVAAGGHWGHKSFYVYRWMQSHDIDDDMRAFVGGVGTMSSYDGRGPTRSEALLKLCCVNEPLCRVAVSRDTRPLAVLREHYSAPFARRWFVWSPRTHTLFPPSRRHEIAAAVASYSKVRQPRADHDLARLWKSIPVEIFVHILSMVTRT